MNFKRQRQMLRREIRSDNHKAVFVQARACHPELASYDTVIELLKVVESTDSSGFQEKESLLQVVLTEHVECPQPVWAALLLLACFPMLTTLSQRIHSASMSNAERDQLVTTSFLEVIAAYSSKDNDERMFMHLRRLTHRRVFRVVQEHSRILKREQPTCHELLRLHEERCIDEHRHALWPEMRPDERGGNTVREREEQLALLEEFASMVLSRDKLALVIATLVDGFQLRDYVKRMYPSVTGEEHQRLYQRIKRRHSRVVQELRELFTPRWRKIMTANEKAMK